ASFGVTVEDQIAIIAVANYASIGLQGLTILMIAALVLEIEGQQSARVRSLLADNAPPPPVDEAVMAAHDVVAARPFTAVARAKSGADNPDDQPIGTIEDNLDPPSSSDRNAT
ncbi:MAG: hypothetical protein L0221_12350, partial [Chloroflexi bacterium]|nr:hypothetical protein [Chloroflexota bacterium]